MDVDYDYEDIKVMGVVGKPVIARSNRANQLFFVNKRYIKDKILTSAAEQGYKGLLTIGKYGFMVLNIEMNPQKVDVNVHPAKLEVRFEDENKVFKAIYHAIKDSLLKEDLIPDKTKIELDKQIQEKSAWKLDTEATNFSNINSFNTEIKEKIDNLGVLFNTKMQEQSTLESNQNTENSVLPFSTNNAQEIEKVEGNIKQDKKEILVRENIGKKYDFEENEKDELKEHKRGGLFGLFSRKKEDEKQEEEKTDDTQNFIAQIYNNKKDISNLENDTQNTADINLQETKKIDIDEINEKMQKMDDLKIDPNYKDFDEMYALTFGKTKKEEKKIEEEDLEYKVKSDELKTIENLSIFDKLPKNKVPEYKFIGIAFSTYIIIEMNNELYIIDQHAAHERIMYEKIKANYYSETNKDSQLMLLPDIINLSHKDMQIAKDNMEIFEKAGFVLEEFGENTIKLSGVPTVCLDLDNKELFLETLDEINTVARTAKQEIEEKFIATVACKAAVKANMVLTKEEVDSLMKKLLILQNPFTCPHGRPTAIRMTKTDIEKKFSRK